MKTENYEDDLLLWKNEEVLKLANHFHRYCKDTWQHKRVHHFQISKNDLPEFTKIGKINSMKITLAIKAGVDPSQYAFYPTLEVTADDLPVMMYFPLSPMDMSKDDEHYSAFVPGVFKEMIHDNWNKIDITYIDDLFIAQAQDEDGNSLNNMVRVHEFIIDSDMLPFIDDLNMVDDDDKPNITNIKLYPGVDMNKFGSKEFISFTPVLGFTHEKNAPQVPSRAGLFEHTKKETFVEYSRPCPPTCKPPDLKA